MKMQPLGVVLALAFCGATAAKADWEYAKWGMTPQQVVSASKNVATAGTDLEPDGDGNVSELVAPYQSGKYSFQAQFGFDASDRLASVTLVLDDKSAHMDMEAMMAPMNLSAMNMNSADMDQGICHALDMSVNTIYGPPPVRDGGGHHPYYIEKWPDPKNKNNVAYAMLYEVGCYVQYSAIK